MSNLDTTLKLQLERNIWKYAIFLITNKRIFAAILSAFYLTIPDVTASSIGLIILISTLASFLLEIPSGYVSDKLGHKEALVISRVLMLVSTTIFLFADSLWYLIAAGVMLSASQAFMSGTGSAFMHYTLRVLGREKDYAEVIGKVSSIGFAVPIIFTVLIPFLVIYGYKIPFLISLIFDIIGLLAALSLKKPPVTPEEIAEIGTKNFRQVLVEGYRLHFLAFALFSGILTGLLFASGVFRGAYQVVLEVPIIWFGVLFGIGRALASLMIFYTGKIKSLFTIYGFMKFQIILFVGLFGLLGLTDNVNLIISILILTNAFQWGLSEVSNSFLVEIIRDSKFKATLLSVRSQIYAMVAALSGLGLGYLIDATSYRLGYLGLAITFIILLVPLYLYIRHRRRDGHHQAVFLQN